MKNKTIFILLTAILLSLCSLILVSGPVSISFVDISSLLSGGEVPEMVQNIFWKIRFPKMITALLAGASLATAGLLMQTYFQNPLAGPFVLGINSGASLGVAFWILGSGLFGVLSGNLLSFGSILFAIGGSLVILLALLFLSFRIPGKVVLLVIGLMFGHMANGIINILINTGDAQKVKSFMVWGLGSFSKVDQMQLPWFAFTILLGLVIAVMQIKKLNILLLGENYAFSLGLNLIKTKIILISITAVLSGAVTAFCGPIAFVGIIVPHIARNVFKSNDHRIVLPSSMLIGGIITLVADYVSTSETFIAIPINAMMGLIGAPVIFVFLWNRRKGEGAL
ncbi:MAG: iron ABC transporter permease [Bacteriovoracaceae bacterium]|nr:iron ABC transporter permease [Bacteriovoracaceae bacterium]